MNSPQRDQKDGASSAADVATAFSESFGLLQHQQASQAGISGVTCFYLIVYVNKRLCRPSGALLKNLAPSRPLLTSRR